MHVVGHQYVGVQGDAVPGQCMAQALAVLGKVLVIHEGCGTVDAAMGDVKGDSGQFEPGAAGHGSRSAWVRLEHAPRDGQGL